jgi:predicted permease
MTTPDTRRGAPWWARAYDVALHAFPGDFRERWGDDMRLTFEARMHAGRAAGRTPWRLLLRELVALLVAGARERLHPPTAPRASMLHLRDVRYALRLLARSPGFTLLTVLVLAGGLGLSTFTFSFLHTAMLRPLPLSEGERIVRIDPEVQGRQQALDVVDLRALRGASGSAFGGPPRTLREIGGYAGREVVLGRDEGRRVVDATIAEPVLFTVARTPALHGRTLLPADGQVGAEPVIVLSHRLWEVAFGADPAVVGTTVPVDGASTRVVGVMPPRFGFPVASEAWMALPADVLASTEPGTHALRLVARLAPGASHAEAATEVGLRLRRAIAARDTSVRSGALAARVESFPAAQIGEERALVFTALNLVAALILLLALVNVTNLLIARANERIRETAVRLALGASTGRLAMQGMWETVLLCVTGGVIGTAGAAWGLAAITRWTRAHLEENLAFWWVWRMDHVTLLCAGAFVTVAIAVLGGVVALRTTRTNVREVIQDGSARSGSRRDGRLSRALVGVQVTTVTVLMFVGVMAGVMAQRVVTLDPGFATARLLQGGVTPPAARHATAAARAAALHDVHARLAEQRALDGALLRRTLAEVRTEGGRFVRRDAAAPGASAHVIAALGDMGTMGVRVLEGRALAASDDASRAPVAMISRSLAARHWRGRSPVGDQLRLTGVGDTTRFLTIVGVASDVPHGDPLARDRSSDAVYVPLLQTDASDAGFLVRYRVSEVAGRQALLQAFAQVNPLLVPEAVQPFDEVLARMGMIATSTSRLFAACFAFALLLALVGTYGLMSRAIGLRTREIGVRRALGASDGSVARLLLRQGGRQLGVSTLVAAPILAAIGGGFMYAFPISGWITAAAAALVSLAVLSLVLAATSVPIRAVLRVTPRHALWRE